MKKEEYIQSLKKSKYKITPQRIGVIDYLNRQPGHFTAEDVYRNVKKVETTITQATVYNVLRVLKNSGAITSFEADGQTWFETNLEFHGNLVCRKCGKIEDVQLDPESIKTSELLGDRKIESATLIMSGLCSDCARKESLDHQ